MDEQRFDRLAKALATAMPRRTLLRGAAAGLAGAVGLRAARAGAGQPKRPLCHATGDPASPWVVISVADPAQPAHLAHGDHAYVDCCADADCAAPQTCGGGGTAGACGAPTTTTTPTPTTTTTPTPTPGRIPCSSPADCPAGCGCDYAYGRLEEGMSCFEATSGDCWNMIPCPKGELCFSGPCGVYCPPGA